MGNERGSSPEHQCMSRPQNRSRTTLTSGRIPMFVTTLLIISLLQVLQISGPGVLLTNDSSSGAMGMGRMGMVLSVEALSSSSQQPSTSTIASATKRGRNFTKITSGTNINTNTSTTLTSHYQSREKHPFGQHHRHKVQPLDITSSTQLSNFIKSKKSSSSTSLHATRSNDNNDDHLSSKSLRRSGSSTSTSTDVDSDNSRATLLGTFASFFVSTVVLAKLDLIGPYTNELIARDTGAALLSTILALIFVKTVTALAAKGVLQPRDSRKIIHTLSAPLFMLVGWPLFTNLWGARLFAASVPLLQAVRLWLAAMNRGGEESSELAGAISRSGDEKEALGGPFIYVVVLFIATILCFRDNYTAMMALSAMAAGDGMADIIGRRFGKGNKWFFNKDKSVAGTVAFIVASSICSIGLGLFLQSVGAITVALPFAELVGKFVTISALVALIELIPAVDDNWSVPIGAAILSLILLN